MRNILLLVVLVPIFVLSCKPGNPTTLQGSKLTDSMENKYPVRLITLDPGHFHAALVQKRMYEQVSPDVYVYAPDGSDYKQHLSRIDSYNGRGNDPTSWKEIIYTGSDYLEKMLADKTGNVVVLSGNNKKKAEYISKSVSSGFNVLADKPMIVEPEDFPLLEAAFSEAKAKGLLLYDIMTERRVDPGAATRAAGARCLAALLAGHVQPPDRPARRA